VGQPASIPTQATGMIQSGGLEGASGATCTRRVPPDDGEKVDWRRLVLGKRRKRLRLALPLPRGGSPLRGVPIGLEVRESLTGCAQQDPDAWVVRAGQTDRSRIGILARGAEDRLPWHSDL